MSEAQTYQQHQVIMAACQRGAISPQRALQAAIDAAAGEDIEYLSTLVGVRGLFSAAAQAIPDLSERVMNVLAHSHQTALQQAHQALDRGHAANYAPDEFAALFPPGAKLGPAEEDDPGPHPSRPHPIKPSEDVGGTGYTRASADERSDADYAGLYGHDGKTYGELDRDERELDPRQKKRQPRASAIERQQWMDEKTFVELFGRAPRDGELEN